MIECLSFHARYRCAHSGACCRAGWDLPFTDEERAHVERLHLISGDAFAAGSATGSGLGTHIAARRTDGACVFLEEATQLCRVHSADGQRALPLTCRMFPRIVRHDATGTRMSLSHYCPTAARLLFADDGGARIVEAPESLVDVGPLDGLDARHELPPLLRPDVLMDAESYRAWESRGVEILAAPDASPREAIDRLAAITRQIVVWTPGSRPLIDVVTEAAEHWAADRTDHGLAADRTDHGLAADRADHGLAADHADQEFRVSILGPRSSSAVNRWLAARLFGNWIAYQGRGLETIVRYLQACLDAFTIELARDGNPLEAIRRADYLLVHEAESQEMADLLS